LPGKEQLERYVNRLDFFNSTTKIKKLIAMSECSKSYAEHNLQVKNIEGIEILPVSWKDVYKFSEMAYSRSFCPTNVVKTGNIFRNGRVWCMLDTLFTCDTISDARDETKSRL